MHIQYYQSLVYNYMQGFLTGDSSSARKLETNFPVPVFKSRFTQDFSPFSIKFHLNVLFHSEYNHSYSKDYNVSRHWKN